MALFRCTGGEEKSATWQLPWKLGIACAVLLLSLRGDGLSDATSNDTVALPSKVATPPLQLNDYGFLLERVMEEHGWQAERADGAIVEYLRFLQLLAASPRMELVASSDVDLVWHEHILDTKNYATDSMRLFGRFLHHRRARNAKEYADIPTAYRRTQEAYRARFGLEPPEQFWGASTNAASMCGGGGGGLDPSATGQHSSNSNSNETNSTNDGGANAAAGQAMPVVPLAAASFVLAVLAA